MNRIFNYVINSILRPAFRFRNKIICCKSTKFLKSFNIIGGNIHPVEIGCNCLIGGQIIFEGGNAHVKIGNNVFLGDSKIICKESVVLGSGILVSWGVTFYDHNSHSLNEKERKKDIIQALDDFNESGNFICNKNWSVVESCGIIVEDDVWIGMEALILKGVTIGKGAIVGARSVVTKNVPPYTVVAGNPARIVKEIKPSNS